MNSPSGYRPQELAMYILVYVSDKYSSGGFDLALLTAEIEDHYGISRATSYRLTRLAMNVLGIYQ